MSSLIYLGVSAIVFFIIIGYLMGVTTIILGSFFSALDEFEITNPVWSDIRDKNNTFIEILISSLWGLLLIIAFLKVVMSASSYGKD